MLWYKGWLETRYRIIFTVAAVVLGLHMIGGYHGRMPFSSFLSGMLSMYVVMASLMLAGAGIATQPPFQATKGLHGSMLFTLSLPVSRLRLLAVRACVGWVEMACLTAIFCSAIWLRSPLVRTMVLPFEMAEYTANLIACATPIYFLSVLLATFLEDQWRIWGTMIAVGGMWWLAAHTALPAFADILRAMGKDSPLIAHVMPWSTVWFSLVLSIALFVAALKIVRTREY
jgi:hypothetical protein